MYSVYVYNIIREQYLHTVCIVFVITFINIVYIYL